VKHVHIRELKTGAIVHSMPAKRTYSDKERENMVMGMLRNLDREQYFVDDSGLISSNPFRSEMLISSPDSSVSKSSVIISSSSHR
jgi:hypothetical protein